MTTEAQAFEEFHKALKLDPDEVAFAQRMPDLIRDALHEAGITVIHSELQGSLKKGTALSPLTDVDMFVSLDPEQWGHPETDPVSAEDVGKLVYAALLDHLDVDEIGVEFRRHAIRIELEERTGPHFDLVLAFEVLDGSGDLVIADFEWPNEWKRSWPREIRRAVADRNAAADGRLIHTVRQIKHAVKAQVHGDYPGLVAEGLACRSRFETAAYADLALSVLRQGARELASMAFEPAGREDLFDKIEAISPGLTGRAHRWFQEAAATAERARSLAENGDDDEAIALWHQVFGFPFPQARSMPPSSLKEAAVALTFDLRGVKPTRGFGDV